MKVKTGASNDDFRVIAWSSPSAHFQHCEWNRQTHAIISHIFQLNIYSNVMYMILWHVFNGSIHNVEKSIQIARSSICIYAATIIYLNEGTLCLPCTLVLGSTKYNFGETKFNFNHPWSVVRMRFRYKAWRSVGRCSFLFRRAAIVNMNRSLPLIKIWIPPYAPYKNIARYNIPRFFNFTTPVNVARWSDAELMRNMLQTLRSDIYGYFEEKWPRDVAFCFDL